jgi:hypothetical protein
LPNLNSFPLKVDADGGHARHPEVLRMTRETKQETTLANAALTQCQQLYVHLTFELGHGRFNGTTQKNIQAKINKCIN